MRRQDQDREQEQALAVTLAALLLIGGTLLVRETAGLWPAAALGLGGVMAAYCGPPIVRRVAVAVAVRRFGRQVAAHGKPR
ncbi:hypothetical protein ACF05T_34330 [Streptomyces lateritius]|uniref:Uncharacterized protein n=1 Tax=Streptomyces lateritius TaxID=67313 RepID=A0ABW6YMG2_9ACTN